MLTCSFCGFSYYDCVCCLWVWVCPFDCGDCRLVCCVVIGCSLLLLVVLIDVWCCLVGDLFAGVWLGLVGVVDCYMFPCSLIADALFWVFVCELVDY